MEAAVMEETPVDYSHKMYIVNEMAGHLTFGWSKDNKDEIKRAKKAFHDAKKKGFLFFEPKKKGLFGKGYDEGRPVREFDPDLERVIGIPMAKGG